MAGPADLIAVPFRAARALGSLPGRLASMERSLGEMQHLLARAVEHMQTIDDHTQVMRGHMGNIDASTDDLRDHTAGMNENTERLVLLASPLERVSRESRRARRERARRDPPPAPSA